MPISKLDDELTVIVSATGSTTTENANVELSE